MKVLVLLAVGALVVSCGGGGGPTPIPAEQACGQITSTACAKIFESTCVDAASVVIQGALKTQADCVNTVTQGYCATAQTVCAAGYTYHGDKAATCKDEISKETCGAFNSKLFTAVLAGGSAESAIASLTVSFPVCAQVCTAPM
jgi:hypothetical protein